MISLIQRVLRAEVRVATRVVGQVRHGAVILLGVELGDTEDDARVTARKISSLRFFPDRTPMDRSLTEVAGSCLVVSQFTLAASLLGNNRPSFTRAAPAATAEILYDRVVEELRRHHVHVQTGEFGAQMEVDLVNDGPVTLILRVRGGKVVD